MARGRFQPIKGAVIGFGLMLLAACVTGTSAPSRFYVLYPLAATEAGPQLAPAERCLAIGIGPVELPAYLDRPQIVTRLSNNELKLAEFDQWAEPLKDNLIRVLAENISSLVCTEPITIFPWKSYTPIDYQVAVEVIQLDGELGGKTSMTARWSILEGEDKKPLWMKRSSYSESVDGSGYAAFVAAQSRLVHAFSRDIAETIKALPKE
jgi:uncharacterized lipoprotein YmbA